MTKCCASHLAFSVGKGCSAVETGVTSAVRKKNKAVFGNVFEGSIFILICVWVSVLLLLLINKYLRIIIVPKAFGKRVVINLQLSDLQGEREQNGEMV